uniref:Structural maintenance of chromosomes protein n=1 Tax=Arcella intermedia TaxID=1963864 RepID=A0A6B2KWD3_9EUKA
MQLQNFKSYRGKREIPFKKFTAIIGPNGAGKSNLMDAISFVLGVASQHLRGRQLNDLIFRFETEQKKVKCYVKLFLTDDKNTTTVFKREIKSTDSSTSCIYSVNDEACSFEDYFSALHKFNIFPKQKNFLIFQGGVEDVAQMSGKQITDLIETLSRSGELKQQYNELQIKEKEAKDSTMFAFQKRKGITAEKKQFKEQKVEAEKYNKLREKLEDSIKLKALYQMYSIEREISDLKDSYKSIKKKMNSIEQDQVKCEDEMKQFKKEQGKDQQEILKMKREIRDAMKEIQAKRSELSKINEEKTFFEKKVKETEMQHKAATENHKKSQLALKRCEVEMEDYEKKVSQFEEERKERAAAKDVELTAEQIALYNKTKEAVGIRTTKQTQQLQTIERDQSVDRSSVEGLVSNVRYMEEKREELGKALLQLRPKCEEIERELKEKIGAREKLQRELDEMNSLSHNLTSQQQEITKRLEEIHQRHDEAKTEMISNENKKRFEEAVETMRRLFPGVHGRVLDIAQPKHQRHNLAMTVALGNHMDSIVVDDEKVGFECIEYLKEQRVGIATFLPIESIKSTPVDDSLRNLGKDVHPIIDLLSFDRTFLKPMEFVCGTTLVVETLDQARKLAFGKERRRVVTVDGTLILKSGLMTGGLTSRLERSAKRWDNKEIAKLKIERDSLLKKLTEISTAILSQAKIQQHSSEIQALATNIEKLQFDHQLHKKKQDKIESELKDIDAKMKEMRPQIKKLQAAIEKRNKNIKDVSETIKMIEEEMFAPFSEQVGIENFREYEEKKLNFAKWESERTLELSKEKNRIETVLEYEQRNSENNSKILEEFTAKLKDFKKQSTAVTKQNAEVEAENDKLKVELEKMEKNLQLFENSLTSKNQKVAEVKEKQTLILKKALSQNKQLNTVDSSLEQFRTKRHELFRTCKREDIEIPITKGALPADVDPPVDQLGKVLLEEDEIEVDYSLLSDEIRTSTKTQLEAAILVWQDKIKEFAIQLENLSPNLKAIDRLNDVEKRLEKTNEELEGTKKSARNAIDDFKKVKDLRIRRFTKAFEHISKQIDLIYKELTGGAGTAYLTLDNLEEPYLHGITYNPMPPNKPFGDISNLSGGEKSVAALALLFALHSYKSAPFFILDEIDAALDPTNVNLVANFIRKRAQGSDIQFIIISLKNKCYEKADGLVGVCLNANQESSETFTFDLEPYPIN